VELILQWRTCPSHIFASPVPCPILLLTSFQVSPPLASTSLPPGFQELDRPLVGQGSRSEGCRTCTGPRRPHSAQWPPADLLLLRTKHTVCPGPTGCQGTSLSIQHSIANSRKMQKRLDELAARRSLLAAVNTAGGIANAWHRWLDSGPRGNCCVHHRTVPRIQSVSLTLNPELFLQSPLHREGTV
jgi:hypothetical protein